MSSLNFPYPTSDSTVTLRLRRVRVVWLLLGVLTTLFVLVASIVVADILFRLHGFTTHHSELALIVSGILAICVLVALGGVTLFKIVRQHPILTVMAGLLVVTVLYSPVWIGLLVSWHGRLAAALDLNLSSGPIRALSTEIAILTMVLVGYFVVGLLRILIGDVVTAVRSSLSGHHGVR